MVLPACLLLAACTQPLWLGERWDDAPTETACAWMWVSQPLPEQTAALMSALLAAGITDASVSAEHFGENCIDSATMAVRYFAPMSTRYTIMIGGMDAEALGDRLFEVFAVLEPFLAVEPPLEPIVIDFMMNSLPLTLPVERVRAILANEVRGAALIDMLRKERE